MKIIKASELHYQDERSDKIYEVTLCKVDNNLYQVNFRYGRRGAKMKEGTKTVFPVNLDKAEKIYNTLIQAKTKKGYKIIEEKKRVDDKEALKTVQGEISAETIEERTLKKLKELAKSPKDIKLNRVIWRCGELKLLKAKEIILSLLETDDSLRKYIVCRALGLCAEKEDREVLTALERIYQSSRVDEMCKRAAFEAALRLSNEAEYSILIERLKSKIPIKVESRLKAGVDELKALIYEKEFKEFEAIYNLYLLNTEECRNALLHLLAEIPLKKNYFRQIRHIFKAAEYFDDYEVYALLSYRFEKGGANFNGRSYYTYTMLNGRYRYLSRSEVQKELQKKDSGLAYGSSTRDYLRRRVWRNLRKLAEKGDNNYVKAAIQILLSYNDSDAGRVESQYGYDYSTGRWQTFYYDHFSEYYTFNRILYRNSSRYSLEGLRARCKNGYKPGEEPPDEREEAFPALWDNNCLELIPLLVRSRCERVHQFGLKIMKSNRERLKLSEKELINLMTAPYAITADFGLELFEESYREHTFTESEAAALVGSVSPKVREFIYRYLLNNPELVKVSEVLLYQLITATEKDTVEFTRRFLSENQLSEGMGRQLFVRLTALLLVPEELTDAKIESISGHLIEHFKNIYRKVGLEVIDDLISSPREELQLLGAKIITEHDSFKENCPTNLINRLLESPYSRVKGLGVTLFSRKDDIELLGEKELLLKFALNSAVEVREAVGPVIVRLAHRDSTFANDMIGLLILKVRKLNNEEIEHFIVKLLKDELGDLKELSLKLIMKLIRSKSTLVQELGGHFLANSIVREQVDIIRIIELANCDSLKVRELARELATERIEHLRERIDQTVRLLDLDWEDSRHFFFNLIKENFREEDFTPAALVSICDSVRDDVSSFGREIIAEYFHGEHSIDYLLKLSEHPSVSMQSFVTGYLSEYAGGDRERLKRLVPYFRSLLCRVNRAGTAKREVSRFLEREALANEESARIIAPLLNFVSATQSKKDKANYIDLMVKVKRQHPQIELPVEIQEIGARDAI